MTDILADILFIQIHFLGKQLYMNLYPNPNLIVPCDPINNNSRLSSGNALVPLWCQAIAWRNVQFQTQFHPCSAYR